MKKLTDIKIEQSAKVDELMKKCLVFWAFSNQQFTENKTELQPGEKYVSIGAGGYMPKGQVNNWNEGWKNINTWYKAAIKDNKARKINIAYELNNHEAYYTNDIQDTLDTLGSDYTRNEVQAVFNKEKIKEYAKY